MTVKLKGNFRFVKFLGHPKSIGLYSRRAERLNTVNYERTNRDTTDFAPTDSVFILF